MSKWVMDDVSEIGHASEIETRSNFKYLCGWVW